MEKIQHSRLISNVEAEANNAWMPSEYEELQEGHTMTDFKKF